MGLIIAISILSLLGVYIYLISPKRVTENSRGLFKDTYYAHRGLHTKDGAVPENSAAAFEAAVKAGYGIELDVHITSDGELIVFHDDDLLRMCGVKIRVGDSTYKQLLEYRLLDTDERIMLFSEVLQQVAGRCPLVVELKNGWNNKTLCEKTAEMLDGYRGEYCIESFHPMIVRWFYKNRPEVVRGQLAAGRRQYKNIPAYQGAMLSALLANVLGRPHFVSYRHEDARKHIGLRIVRLLGGKLVGWTVHDTDDLSFCRRFFDAIIFELLKP